MPPLPTGTVTFLFTDVEGSTKLWEEQPAAMRSALARHDALLRQAIEANSGIVFKTVGDAFCAAFATAPDALNAALQAQLQLNHEKHEKHEKHGEERAGVTDPASALQGHASASGPSLASSSVSSVVQLKLRVRMALHTGAAELRDNDYFGPPLNRVARLLAIGHGAQTLVSAATQELTRDTLPASGSLCDAGEHRLRDLGRPETVFQLNHPSLPSEFPPLKSLDNPQLPNNLPQQTTRFIGREKEMEAVKLLLAKTRLLTLTGSGGGGKTRLSLQVAADIMENYPDGVWFVELASLADPALVPQTLAQTLNVTEEPGKPLAHTLAAALKNKRLLLMLDNCEHLLDACARLLDTLLRSCPHVQIFASSREALSIAGELTYRLPSLSLPDQKQAATLAGVMQYEAAQLFVERALCYLPAFEATNANAPAIASICQRLDGIPLAIELAAARIRSLSLEEINSKLDNRFRLLTGGSRAALPRQQTLRALIDWSYDLLTPQEKTLLRRLSVFAGGWTLAAAEQVGVGASDRGTGESIEEWEVLDLLTGLADKSLVLAQPSGEATRYRLLETVRQYARDRLLESGESLTVRARHGERFLALAEEIKPKLSGPSQAQWFEVLEAEHDNLRQALTLYAEDTQDRAAGEKGLRLGAALTPFWEIRGFQREGREWLAVLLAHPQGQAASRARIAALQYAGLIDLLQGNMAQSADLLEESLTLAHSLGDKEGTAGALDLLGNKAYNQGHLVQARTLYEESLALWRELGHKQGIADTLIGVGTVAQEQGNFLQARTLYEESLALRRESGHKRGIAGCLSNLGYVAQYQGDYDRARVLCEESLAIRRELRDAAGTRESLYEVGWIARSQGDYEQARAFYAEMLAVSRNLGQTLYIAWAFFGLGSVSWEQADYVQARAFYEESLALHRELGYKFGMAWSLSELGMVSCEQQEYGAARVQNRESLTIARELGNKRLMASNLEAYACLAHAEAQEERCVCLWGAAAALRAALGSPMVPSMQARQKRETALARTNLGDNTFVSAWAQGQAMTLEQAADYALKANDCREHPEIHSALESD